MRRFNTTVMAAALAAGTVLVSATPAQAAPADVALAAPTCQTLQSSTSFQGRCKSWNLLASYRAVALCTNGSTSVYREGDFEYVGNFNTYGDWSRATCPTNYWIVSAHL
jgi:hypothetical protein